MASSQEEPPPADAEMAEASSSDSSGSDSDFEEVDISPEDTKLLMRLEQALQDNPNLYDSHVQASRAAEGVPPQRHVVGVVCVALPAVLCSALPPFT